MKKYGFKAYCTKHEMAGTVATGVMYGDTFEEVREVLEKDGMVVINYWES